MIQPHIIGNRYRIDKVLGQGGMGQVYYGYDLQNQELVAIKALKSHIVERDPRILERFRREGEALKELNHPNIVKMLAAVEEHGQHYLVMEYVEGGSLYDLLKSGGKLPIERVLYISLGLSDALIRAHGLQIIHRDIKPANVLLAKDGTPRLTDFGAARLEKLDDLTQEGGIVGTASYLSPEVCQGEKPDARADIWAFGVMLFEMLSGRRPFDRSDKLATVLAIVREPLPDLVALLPDAPPQMVELIYKMLEKDPDRRIASMRLVGAELESIIKHADSGVRQALNLIYRMLENDAEKPIAGMRLVGSTLSSTSTQPAATQRTQSLKVGSFEKATPESAASTLPAPARRASSIKPLLLGGMALAVIVVVVVALLLL